MSTDKMNIIVVPRANQAQRFQQLAVLGETLFHASDLAALWQISNKNTLNITLSRYCKHRLIQRVYKGLYSLIPIEQQEPWVVGLVGLHSFGYISAESVLFHEGIIHQPPQAETLISSISKNMQIGPYCYHVRQLADHFLFQSIGVISEKRLKRASISRAVADILYYNPLSFFDQSRCLNWKEVRKIQEQVGYPLTPERYEFT